MFRHPVTGKPSTALPPAESTVSPPPPPPSSPPDSPRSSSGSNDDESYMERKQKASDAANAADAKALVVRPPSPADGFRRTARMATSAYVSQQHAILEQQRARQDAQSEALKRELQLLELSKRVMTERKQVADMQHEMQQAASVPQHAQSSNSTVLGKRSHSAADQPSETSNQAQQGWLFPPSAFSSSSTSLSSSVTYPATLSMGVPMPYTAQTRIRGKAAWGTHVAVITDLSELERTRINQFIVGQPYTLDIEGLNGCTITWLTSQKSTKEIMILLSNNHFADKYAVLSLMAQMRELQIGPTPLIARHLN